MRYKKCVCECKKQYHGDYCQHTSEFRCSNCKENVCSGLNYCSKCKYAEEGKACDIRATRKYKICHNNGIIM
ncbi:hypothetical protein HZS_1016 [Henneguya salminicola]|nr:hypothetical protein HZS_1016 [Henneguya salminicola]